ncbi:MAG TPA: orotate phosphoribosyltransferase [Aquificae bacterium]|nr:orotate phosphoribosyltransferase [Aquificota bacterium]
MTENEIKELFLKTNAFLEGHFLLSSGLHSPYYIQCAKVLQYPFYAEKLCRALIKKIKNSKIDIDLVIGPALGAVIVSYETAYQASKYYSKMIRGIFAERDKTDNDKLKLRRGFEIKEGEKVLVVEDVVTTGKSTRETIDLVKAYKGQVVAVASLIDRRPEKVDYFVDNNNEKYPFFTLWKLEIPTYDEKNCPLCKEGIKLVKPGSRTIIK